MKKKIGLILMGLFLFTIMPYVSSAEGFALKEPIESSTKAVTITKWFPNKPPEKFNGKKLIHSYKKSGGYVGVYV